MISALVYIAIVSIRKKLISRDLFRFAGTDRSHWRGILGRFGAFVVASTVAVALWRPQLLFSIVRDNPLLWLTMLVIYCFFSVLPQVLVFRAFFFARYMRLFRSRGLALLVSAVVCLGAYRYRPSGSVRADFLWWGDLFAHVPCDAVGVGRHDRTRPVRILAVHRWAGADLCVSWINMESMCAVRTRLRPVSLASYNAASAARYKLSGSPDESDSLFGVQHGNPQTHRDHSCGGTRMGNTLFFYRTTNRLGDIVRVVDIGMGQ